MNQSRAKIAELQLVAGLVLLALSPLPLSCRQIIGVAPSDSTSATGPALAGSTGEQSAAGARSEFGPEVFGASGESGASSSDVVAEGGAFYDTTWVDCTHNLPTGAFLEPGEVRLLSAEPSRGRVIAGLRELGLFVTSNDGETWSRLGRGKGSAAITHVPTSIVYDPTNAGVFWESGIYGSGIYKTSDSGLTFEQLGTIGQNDFLSVDFSDPARQTLLAGAHEQAQTLYKSTDGGKNWSDIGANLESDSSFASLPLIIDTQTFLLGQSDYSGGDWGVIRTTNGGTSWIPVSLERVAGWPLPASDGSIYWLLQSDGMILSTNHGETWSKCGAGPIPTDTAGPLELPDGRIITLGATRIIVSADQCKTWKEVGQSLPFSTDNFCGSSRFTYSTFTDSVAMLFVSRADCSARPNADRIWHAILDLTNE